MGENDVVSRVIRAAVLFGGICVGFAVTQPWGYFGASEPTTNPASATDTVLGIETITGVVSLGLAALGILIVLRQWNLRSLVVLSVFGALIELFGLTQAVTYPPEATNGLLYLLGGGALVLIGGLVGVIQRVLAGDADGLPSSSVAILGSFLVAVSPFFGHANCLGQDRPCIEYLWLSSELELVASFVPFVLVVALTHVWDDQAQRMTVLLGAVSFVLSGFVLILIYIPGRYTGFPPRLTRQLYPLVATIGGLVILLGGLRAMRTNRTQKQSKPNRETPMTESRRRKYEKYYIRHSEEILSATLIISGLFLVLAPISYLFSGVEEFFQSGLLLIGLGTMFYLIDWMWSENV